MSHGASHWHWGIPWGIPIGQTESSAFYFGLKVSGGHPIGCSNYMGCPRWVIPQRAVTQNTPCRLPNRRRWPRWVVSSCSNSIFHAFKVRNLLKLIQTLSNEFKSVWTLSKIFKTSPTYWNINFWHIWWSFSNPISWTIWNIIKIIFKYRKLISRLLK